MTRAVKKEEEVECGEMLGSTENIAENKKKVKKERVKKERAKKEAPLVDPAHDEDSDFELPMSDLAAQLLSGAKKEERPDWAPNGKCYWLQLSPSNRATCKPCSRYIALGEVRFGSAAMERFHGSFMWRHTGCVTAQQLRNVADTYETDDYAIIPGWDTALDADGRAKVSGQFDKAKKIGAKKEKEKQAKREAAEAAKRQREQRKERREAFSNAPGDWFDWKGLLENGELELEPATFLGAVLDFLGLSSAGTKKQLVARLWEHANGTMAVDSEQVSETAPGNVAKQQVSVKKEAKKELKRRRRANVKVEHDMEDEIGVQVEEWGTGFEGRPSRNESTAPGVTSDVMEEDKVALGELIGSNEGNGVNFAKNHTRKKRKAGLRASGEHEIPGKTKAAKRVSKKPKKTNEAVSSPSLNASVSRAERAARRTRLKGT